MNPALQHTLADARAGLERLDADPGADPAALRLELGRLLLRLVRIAHGSDVDLGEAAAAALAHEAGPTL
jgi:hypothetical protein